MLTRAKPLKRCLTGVSVGVMALLISACAGNQVPDLQPLSPSRTTGPAAGAALGVPAVSATSLLRLADATRAAGDTTSAISLYHRASLAASGDAGLQIKAGFRLHELGAFAEADGAFRRALAVAPEDSAALRGLGNTLVARDLPRHAIEHFEAAIAAGGDFRAYSGLGVALDMTGDRTAAQRSYLAGLEREPENLTLLNNLGLSLALSGRPQEAISVLGRVAASPDATARHRQNLALAYGLAGRPDMAADVSNRDLAMRDVRSNLGYYAWLRTQPVGAGEVAATLEPPAGAEAGAASRIAATAANADPATAPANGEILLAAPAQAPLYLVPFSSAQDGSAPVDLSPGATAPLAAHSTPAATAPSPAPTLGVAEAARSSGSAPAEITVDATIDLWDDVPTSNTVTLADAVAAFEDADPTAAMADLPPAAADATIDLWDEVPMTNAVLLADAVAPFDGLGAIAAMADVPPARMAAETVADIAPAAETVSETAAEIAPIGETMADTDNFYGEPVAADVADVADAADTADTGAPVRQLAMLPDDDAPAEAANETTDEATDNAADDAADNVADDVADNGPAVGSAWPYAGDETGPAAALPAEASVARMMPTQAPQKSTGPPSSPPSFPPRGPGNHHHHAAATIGPADRAAPADRAGPTNTAGPAERLREARVGAESISGLRPLETAEAVPAAPDAALEAEAAEAEGADAGEAAESNTALADPAPYPAPHRAQEAASGDQAGRPDADRTPTMTTPTSPAPTAPPPAGGVEPSRGKTGIVLAGSLAKARQVPNPVLLAAGGAAVLLLFALFAVGRARRRGEVPPE